MAKHSQEVGASWVLLTSTVPSATSTADQNILTFLVVYLYLKIIITKMQVYF